MRFFGHRDAWMASGPMNGIFSPWAQASPGSCWNSSVRIPAWGTRRTAGLKAVANAVLDHEELNKRLPRLRCCSRGKRRFCLKAFLGLVGAGKARCVERWLVGHAWLHQLFDRRLIVWRVLRQPASGVQAPHPIAKPSARIHGDGS